MNYFDLENLSPRELNELLTLVHKYTGITMSTSKQSLIQGRIRRRVRELKLASYFEYVEYLKTNTDEVESFINLATTNETYFFRTQRVWDHLSNEFLHRWYELNQNKTLRVWSAASSTGEEAYTIAMCCEEFKVRNPKFNYEVIGSDISTDVLKKASSGIYQGRPIDLFKVSQESLFKKYMVKKSNDDYAISDMIKRNVHFVEHNLFDPVQMGQFDLIFLRNVLIYFVGSDQEKVLRNIEKAMTPDGELIIGESESLTCIKTDFKYIGPLIYKKVA